MIYSQLTQLILVRTPPLQRLRPHRQARALVKLGRRVDALQSVTPDTRTVPLKPDPALTARDAGVRIWIVIEEAAPVVASRVRYVPAPINQRPGHLPVTVLAGPSIDLCRKPSVRRFVLSYSNSKGIDTDADVQESSPFARPAPRRHGVCSKVRMPFGQQVSFAHAVRPRREVALAALAHIAGIHRRHMTRVEIKCHEIRRATQRIEEARIVDIVSIGND